MEVIGHQDRCKHAPFPKFRSGILECVESCIVCEHAFAVFNADRDEINYRLFPAQPNGNSWRMTHLESVAGEAPGLQCFSHAKGNREW